MLANVSVTFQVIFQKRVRGLHWISIWNHEAVSRNHLKPRSSRPSGFNVAARLESNEERRTSFLNYFSNNRNYDFNGLFFKSNIFGTPNGCSEACERCLQALFAVGMETAESRLRSPKAGRKKKKKTVRPVLFRSLPIIKTNGQLIFCNSGWKFDFWKWQPWNQAMYSKIMMSKKFSPWKFACSNRYAHYWLTKFIPEVAKPSNWRKNTHPYAVPDCVWNTSLYWRKEWEFGF